MGMEQTEIQEIRQKSSNSLFFLTLRNFGIQAIATLGFFLLTLLLGTGEVGLFAIVAESVGILGYFSDIGLASALIQQKEEPTTKELRSTFFIQQSLVLIALLLMFFIYPRVSQTKGYSQKELLITISLCFAFVAASLKTIPSILLERHLNFQLLSTIDIVENITFYLVAVIFAFLNFGGYSYAIATFVRSSFGLIIIYYKSPWPIGLDFCLSSIKKLFRFGIPFQLNSFIAMAKDKLSNLLVAGIIGREAFGLLSWAQKGPRIPLSLMDSIMRVSFPAFSRLQHNKETLTKALEKSLSLIALLTFPALAGICLIAPDIVNIIPKYSKWQPAVFLLYFFSINAAIAAITTPLTNAFNAVGKITITTKFMIMWTILTWLFYPVLSLKYGYTGTAIATLIVGCSSIFVWFTANAFFSFNIFKTIVKPLVGTIFMIICVIPIKLFPVSNHLILILKIIGGISSYSLFVYYTSRQEIVWFTRQLSILKNAKTKN